MIQTIDTFERTVHVTNGWLAEVAHELGEDDDRQAAYRALRAVLHALRDRLPTTESAQLAAELPMLLRGVYYEGWRPSRTPETYHDVDRFLQRVAHEANLAGETEASVATTAAMTVLRRHVAAGELADVLADLPGPVRALIAG